MVPLDEAQAYVRAQCPNPTVASVLLSRSLGHVLAIDVEAPENVPRFDNTAMDGFAVRAADTTGAPIRLRVVGTLSAGTTLDLKIERGEAARIMTGAPLPAGADAIVMLEQTSQLARSADGSGEVEVEVSVPVGNHVRFTGEDLKFGQTVFLAGTVITPGHIGVLASLGQTQVRVFARPRVGVLSTGDELVADSRSLSPGQIRDSNRPGLLALVAASGFDPVDLGLVRDNESDIEDALMKGVEDCDAILTSGGVSVGDFDYVKIVLDRIGEMRWMQVAIRPSKPLAFGTIDDVPVFGLPGNPVSSMVSFELFARPGLRAMAGHTVLDRRSVQAIAEGPLDRRPDGKIHFVRVTVEYRDGCYFVASAGGQGSHQLSAMAGADGLAILPDGSGVGVGDVVAVLLLD